MQNTPGMRIKNTHLFDPLKNKKIPGPGSYNTSKENINVTGKFFNSKFSSSRSRTFSKTSRDVDDGNSGSVIGKKKLPGPGAYNIFTDFGAKMRV